MQHSPYKSRVILLMVILMVWSCDVQPTCRAVDAFGNFIHFEVPDEWKKLNRSKTLHDSSIEHIYYGIDGKEELDLRKIETLEFDINIVVKNEIETIKSKDPRAIILRKYIENDKANIVYRLERGDKYVYCKNLIFSNNKAQINFNFKGYDTIEFRRRVSDISNSITIE